MLQKGIAYAILFCMEKDIQEFHERVLPTVTRAGEIVIEDEQTMEEATTLLSNVNKNLDAIKAEKEKVLKPLREAANAEKARWEPLEKVLKPLVETLRKKMSAYQTALVKKKAEDDAKLAARVGEGKGKLKAETAIRKMGENTVQEKTETAAGSVGFREKKVLKITDEKKVPQEYWVIDEAKLMVALKAGKEVPGAEIDIEMVPVNKR